MSALIFLSLPSPDQRIDLAVFRLVGWIMFCTIHLPNQPGSCKISKPEAHIHCNFGLKTSANVYTSQDLITIPAILSYEAIPGKPEDSKNSSTTFVVVSL